MTFWHFAMREHAKGYLSRLRQDGGDRALAEGVEGGLRNLSALAPVEAERYAPVRYMKRFGRVCGRGLGAQLLRFELEVMAKGIEERLGSRKKVRSSVRR